MADNLPTGRRDKSSESVRSVKGVVLAYAQEGEAALWGKGGVIDSWVKLCEKKNSESMRCQ